MSFKILGNKKTEETKKDTEPKGLIKVKMFLDGETNAIEQLNEWLKENHGKIEDVKINDFWGVSHKEVEMDEPAKASMKPQPKRWIYNWFNAYTVEYKSKDI